MRIFRQTRSQTHPLDFVQLYGERNSGTSFMSKLLQANQRIPSNFLGKAASEETPLGTTVFGYKHWFINWEKLTDERQPQTLFVVIYRNPYTWIRAMMARPYALEKSIGGRPLAELPSIKLAGHLKGKDTRNEFHPDTGERLTLFELRKLKIEHFEGLKDKVDNIAYVNVERLVSDPAGTMTALRDAFPSAFRDPLDLSLAAPSSLKRECTKPENFSEHEMHILNSALDWAAERQIGYAPGDYSVADTPS